MLEEADAARRFRTRTIGGVLRELGRVYRAGWSGDLTWTDAASAARILREIRAAIEGGELERRIEALEASLGTARPNGHDKRAARP